MDAISNGHAMAFPACEAAGLSKREYFAGLAMMALVGSNDEGAGDRLTDIPEYAVQIADALLRELAKEQP